MSDFTFRGRMRLAEPSGTEPNWADARDAADEYLHEPARVTAAHLAAYAFAQGVLAERAAAEGPTQPLQEPEAQEPAATEDREFLITSELCGERYSVQVYGRVDAAEGAALALDSIGHVGIRVFELHECHVEITPDFVSVEAP